MIHDKIEQTFELLPRDAKSARPIYPPRRKLKYLSQIVKTRDESQSGPNGEDLYHYVIQDRANQHYHQEEKEEASVFENRHVKDEFLLAIHSRHERIPLKEDKLLRTISHITTKNFFFPNASSYLSSSANISEEDLRALERGAAAHENDGEENEEEKVVQSSVEGTTTISSSSSSSEGEEEESSDGDSEGEEDVVEQLRGEVTQLKKMMRTVFVQLIEQKKEIAVLKEQLAAPSTVREPERDN